MTANKGGKRVLLTSTVAGKSLVELTKLKEIIKIAKESLKNHREIVSKNMNVEFSIEPESSLDLNSDSLREIIPTDRYSDTGIKEINIRRVGKKVNVYIRRKSI